MNRRKRRGFSEEQKAAAVEHVRKSGKTVYQAARDLDLTETALRRWIAQAEVDAGRGEGGKVTSAEREELQRLRRENQRLRMEREFPKKAAAFFARETSERSS